MRYKKGFYIIVICLIATVVLSSCSRKTTISNTFFADDLEGKTYHVYADGTITSDGLADMSYEQIKGNKFILHLDKADVVASYDSSLELIDFRYDGIVVHWYNDYLTAEKSRSERGFVAIAQSLAEEQARLEAEEQERIKAEEEARAEEARKKEEEAEKKAKEEEEQREKEANEKSESQKKLENDKKLIVGTWIAAKEKMVFSEDGNVEITSNKNTEKHTYEVTPGLITLNEGVSFAYEFIDDNTMELTIADAKTKYTREGKKNE